MRTLETQQFQTETNPDLNKKIKTINTSIEEKVNSLMASADVFGLHNEEKVALEDNLRNNHNKIKEGTTEYLTDFSDEMEVNLISYQLANIFLKGNEMKNLNLKSYSEPYSPLGDMTAFEEEFKMAA